METAVLDLAAAMDFTPLVHGCPDAGANVSNNIMSVRPAE